MNTKTSLLAVLGVAVVLILAISVSLASAGEGHKGKYHEKRTIATGMETFTYPEEKKASSEAHVTHVHKVVFDFDGVYPKNIRLYEGMPTKFIIASHVNCAFYVPNHQLMVPLKPGVVSEVVFTAGPKGTYEYSCQGLKGPVGATGHLTIR